MTDTRTFKFAPLQNAFPKGSRQRNAALLGPVRETLDALNEAGLHNRKNRFWDKPGGGSYGNHGYADLHNGSACALTEPRPCGRMCLPMRARRCARVSVVAEGVMADLLQPLIDTVSSVYDWPVVLPVWDRHLTFWGASFTRFAGSVRTRGFTSLLEAAERGAVRRKINRHVQM